MSRPVAIVVVLLGLVPPTSASPLAREAAAVLRKYCISCHNDGPTARAGLSLLDREQLLELRRLVVPMRPQSSELMWLMDAGSMPPGNRPKPTIPEREAVRRWIQAGAPPDITPSARLRGPEYVLSVLAADAAALTLERRRSARYVSFNHLDPPAREPARKELERILTSFALKGILTAIDDPASVFRLDLTVIGWDRKLFRIGEGKEARPSPLDVFDLVLIEYPYGQMLFDSPTTPGTVDYLRTAAAIRPIPYVRGDWLAAILTNRRFGAEVMLLLGRDGRVPTPPPASVWPEVLRLDRAERELEWRGEPGRLKRALDEVGLEELPLGRPIFRRAWEVRYPQLVAKLGLGTPVVPLEGLTILDVPGDGSLRLVPTLGRARLFKGDTLQALVRTNREAVARLLHLDASGVLEQLVEGQNLARGEKLPLGPGFKLTDEAVPGDNSFLILAVPRGAPALPPGDIHEATLPGRKIRDRYILRAYRLNAAGTGFEGSDLSRAIKATAVYEYAGAKK